MLTHLSIHNYTLVDRLNLEFHAGMTAITGETGAGKSILLDALGLTLGDRADVDHIRAGQKQADIHASFDIRRLPAARAWLEENALSYDGLPHDGLPHDRLSYEEPSRGEADHGEHECLLRRVITREGRSRAFVNGQPVTVAQLRTLGEMLIDIHAQHEHQSLLSRDTQRRLLDEFGGHIELTQQVRDAFQRWQGALARLTTLRDHAEENSARLQLLRYQVEELDQLALLPGELEQLEAEQKNLANGEAILQRSYQLIALCGSEDNSILEGLNRACSLASQLPDDIPALKDAAQLLCSAQIQVEEAQREIERHIDNFHLDPERLQAVEERLSAVFDIARKHRIQPSELVELHHKLSLELQSLQGGDGDLEQLAARVKTLEKEYLEPAGQLSQKRQTAAQKLAKAVNQQLAKLAMEHAKLRLDLAPLEAAGAHGLEEVEIVISTNPGQPLKPLAKIASGGELSRISLAIQVVTAQTSTTPTLVFDEVDVGIGGATADVVGQLLRQLGDKAQVLCVTHLAQVAGKAHHHKRVNKITKSGKVTVTLETLSKEQQVEEIGRMIGTDKLTAATLEHAREIVNQSLVASR